MKATVFVAMSLFVAFGIPVIGPVGIAQACEPPSSTGACCEYWHRHWPPWSNRPHCHQWHYGCDIDPTGPGCIPGNDDEVEGTIDDPTADVDESPYIEGAWETVRNLPPPTDP